jgi:thymidine kinase
VARALGGSGRTVSLVLNPPARLLRLRVHPGHRLVLSGAPLDDLVGWSVPRLPAGSFVLAYPWLRRAPSVTREGNGSHEPPMVLRLPERTGRLEVVCGPMFSGKSEELMRRLRRAEVAGLRAVIVKPRIDDRFDALHVVSHAGARMRALAVDSAADVLPCSAGYDAVGVDEAQFFEPAIVGVTKTLVRRGVRVIVAGLDMDFRGEPFGSMATLLSVADLVDKLQAVCHLCGGTATRTQRLVDGKPAPFRGPTVQVGARDSYEARCSACYEPDTSTNSAAAARAGRRRAELAVAKLFSIPEAAHPLDREVPTRRSTLPTLACAQPLVPAGRVGPAAAASRGSHVPQGPNRLRTKP